MAAILLACITAVANVADLLLLDYFGPFVVIIWALGTFSGVGLVVALRRPGHPVGWLFLVAGAGFALSFFLPAYSWRALVAAQGTLPAGEVVTWLSTWLWRPTLASMLIAVMLFPSGRPLSRRWALAMAAIGAAFALALVRAAFAPAPIALAHRLTEGPGPGDMATIPNPFGVGGSAGDALLALAPIGDAMVLPLHLLTLLVVIVRFARSAGIERLQLKWFVYAASVSFALFISGLFVPRGIAADINTGLALISIGLIPVAAGVAILRYRLYDIDLLINRTLVYGALTALLGLAYVGGIVLFQTLLRPLTSGSEIAVTASTLAVTLLFGPLRRRIQRGVDRRFYRRRYDAAATVDAFALRLRDSVDLDALTDELLAVVGDTVQPAHASVWLRERAR